ncbi:MAG: Biuret hydrolase [Paracidovorax wautersii]|uniref:Biuret hydrolase n=1 Tax=Paracidovorax wautersii TaxID=1177982 RepID=A0A7V8JQ27_9BURK|nr:MAG: Biuret hydrolase [Paracidovorax wautersii]
MTDLNDFPIDDTVGAWVPHGRFVIAPHAHGALDGLRFAAKDVYDVAGHPTGAGNPAWLASHPIPTASSPLVDRLLGAGASLMGKVLTDELAYSIQGDNIHYGTPLNAAAPGRVTGGSSSGSAAAVAARLVDFALGTDTGGSTRVPASYCSLWGLRTTHGLLSREHMVALHPLFDTCTWLAHDAATFEKVGATLLPTHDGDFRRLFVLEDACAEADVAFAPLVQQVTQALARELNCAPTAWQASGAAGEPGALDDWRQTYVTASAFDGWATHGAWISHNDPGFAPPIAARWRHASTITPEAAQAARAAAARIAAQVRSWLGRDGLAVLPSAASAAPLRDALPEAVDAVRVRTLRMTCIAGLAGLPQVSIPLHGADGLPLGVSLLGPAGSDLALIRLATRVARQL